MSDDQNESGNISEPSSWSNQVDPNRWEISDGVRRLAVARLAQIIGDPESKPSEVSEAIRVLIAAEKQNQTDEHRRDLDVNGNRNQFFARALELGIAKTPRELPDRTAETDSPGIEIEAEKPATKKRATKKRRAKKTTRKKPRRRDSGEN